MSKTKIGLISLSVFFGLILIGNILTGIGLAQYAFWAPKQSKVQREVFEQTKSYQQGMIQDLRKSHEEYVLADSVGKRALATIILHRAADFPEEDLPSDLRMWISELKRLTGGVR
jgi:hypothetical protein